MRYSQLTPTFEFDKADSSCQTTAHTLAFSFILLALYPEIQESLYQHCKSVLGEDDIPVSTLPTLMVCKLLKLSEQKYDNITAYTYALA